MIEMSWKSTMKEDGILKKIRLKMGKGVKRCEKSKRII